MIDPTRLAAVVTAAGASTRMHRMKALLDWGGKGLLQHQLDALAGVGEVVAVLGHRGAVIGSTLTLHGNTRLVQHDGWAEGRSSSLKAGFAALAGTPEAVLVTGVDQPIAPGVVKALCAAMPTGTAIMVPCYEGRRGHPVIFSGDLLGELSAITEAGEGLREVMNRHASAIVELRVNSPEVLYDFNEPDVYYAARKPELDRAIARIPELPMHTTRRSLALYTRKLTELFRTQPELVVTAPDVYISATPVEANHSVWINFGAESIEALERELPQAYARLKAQLAERHEWKGEIWLSHAGQEPVFTRLGWRVASRMVRYSLPELAEYPEAPNVREYEDSDFEQLIGIHRASSAPTEQLSDEAYQDLIHTVDRTAVFELDGKLLGYTHTQIVDDTGLFQGLAVHPDAQGKGVGKALVHEALTYMKSRGAKRIELLALEEAIPARRLYEKVGFAHVADQLWMDSEIPAAVTEASAVVPATDSAEVAG